MYKKNRLKPILVMSDLQFFSYNFTFSLYLFQEPEQQFLKFRIFDATIYGNGRCVFGSWMKQSDIKMW